MNAKTVTYHNITFDGETLEKFCRENGIKKMSLFGSVLRDDFGPESDVDMLVEFLPGEVVGFFRISRTERALSSIFNGIKIDLRTPEDLSDYFRDRVLAESEELYVQR